MGRMGARRRSVTVGALVLALACGSLSAQAASPDTRPPGRARVGTSASAPTSSEATASHSTDSPGNRDDDPGAGGLGEGAHSSGAKRKTAAEAAESTTDHAVYAYDAADRLVGVTDPDGETARYRYDEAGNRLGVDRYPSTQLSVLSVVPAGAAVGAKVTLSGTGFSATAADDAVSFGGAKATVSSASATRLTVTVPSGAADGKVSVAVGDASAQSTESFAVAAGAPVVSKLTPSSGVPDTQVVLSGSGFAANLTDNVVRFNGGTAARLVSATATSVTVRVPQGQAGTSPPTWAWPPPEEHLACWPAAPDDWPRLVRPTIHEVLGLCAALAVATAALGLSDRLAHV